MPAASFLRTGTFFHSEGYFLRRNLPTYFTILKRDAGEG